MACNRDGKNSSQVLQIDPKILSLKIVIRKVMFTMYGEVPNS